MKLFSKEAFDNVNAVFSFASAVIAIVQILLHAPWYYYVITLGTVFAIWLLVCVYRLKMRPWHSKMRNPLIQRNRTYPVSIFFKTVFSKPYYETKFIGPMYSNEMSRFDSPGIDTGRLTVVIEDDPVGYADNVGMLPCIPVEDDISCDRLYERIKALDEEISKYTCSSSRRPADVYLMTSHWSSIGKSDLPCAGISESGLKRMSGSSARSIPACAPIMRRSTTD